MFTHKKFILASSSKSRHKILKLNKLIFFQTKPTCDEELIKQRLLINKKKPNQFSKILAKEKAKSISIKNPKAMVVGCDTTIIFKNKVINKAKTIKEAKSKLSKLSGKKHKIISSLSVFKNKKQIWSCSQTTIVEIRILSKKEIGSYLRLSGKDVLNSVGCYQIELLGPNIIKKINGDFFNVMGFPLFPFLNFLKKFSIR